jgi:cytochrome c oxidase subunit IV
MRKTGVFVLVGSLVLAGLMFIIWLAGLVAGFTLGGFIHLLLLSAFLIGPAGVIVGVLFIVLGKRRA